MDLMGNDSLSFFWVLENCTFFFLNVIIFFDMFVKIRYPKSGNIQKVLKPFVGPSFSAKWLPATTPFPAICQTLGDMSASSPDVEFMEARFWVPKIQDFPDIWKSLVSAS